jgi:hypothetical protein
MNQLPSEDQPAELRDFPAMAELADTASHIRGYHTGTEMQPATDAEAVRLHDELHSAGRFLDGRHEHGPVPCRDIRHGLPGRTCSCQVPHPLP